MRRRLANLTRRVLPALLVLATVGCAGEGDDPPPGAVEPPPPVQPPVQRVHPSLSLHPGAAATFLGDSDFVVNGAAIKGSGALTQLTIGGESAAFSPEGRFEHHMRAEPGVNIVPIKVEADDRGRAFEAMSVFGGDVHPPETKLERAMIIHLGQQLLDDDEEDVDDIARVVEILLVDPGFQSWLETLEFGEDGSAGVETFRAERSKVDFRAEQKGDGGGCLNTVVVIGDATVANDPGFTLGLRLSGAMAILGEEVTITGKQATIAGDLCPSIGVDGTLAVDVETPEVEIVDIAFSTDVYANMEEALPSTHEAIKDLANNFLADALGDALATMLEQFLGSFEFELPIWEDPPISAKFALERFTVSDGAAALELSHEPGVTLGLPSQPLNAGSLATPDAGPNTRLSQRPLAVAISDDLANQMLFSFWWSGVVAHLGLTEMLEGRDTSALPKVFQPLTGVQMSMGLPPTLMTARERDFPYDMAAGEITLTLDVGADKRFVCSLHIRAGADLVGGDDGSIQLKLDNRARKITVAAAVRELPPGLDPGDIAALLRLVIPALLGQSNAALPGLSIPNIDLSKLALLAQVEEFEGKVLALTQPDVKRTGDGGGYVVFEGGAVLKDAPPPMPVRE